MQGLNEIVNQLLTTTMTDSRSSKQCPHCLQTINAIEVELLGRKRWVQPVCQCEQDALKSEMKKAENFQKKREVRELFSISNVGEKYLQATFDNFQMREGAEKAFKIAKYYAEHFDDFGFESVMIYGEPGNGKTHLAAAVHNFLRSQGKVVVFVSMPELLNKIKTTFNKGNKDSEEQILKALNICDLLIIDDLGAEKTSDWVEEKVFTIIDARYRRQKPVFYTSNLPPKDLPSQIGKRACDRLIEMSQPIENKATSYRREIAKGRLSKFDEILKG